MPRLTQHRDAVMTYAEDRILVQEHLAHAAEPKPLSEDEKSELEARIKSALREQDAVLVAHYYMRLVWVVSSVGRAVGF